MQEATRRVQTKRQGIVDDEIPMSDFLPFTYHYDDHTIGCRDGSLLRVLKLDGIPFETIDTEEIVSQKANRNDIFSSIRDDLTAIYTYTIRREETSVPEGVFEQNSVSHAINTAYLSKHSKRRAFINEHYLVVLRRPAIGAQALLKNKISIFYKPHRSKLVVEYRERRDELARSVLEIENKLERYNPRMLSVIEKNGAYNSEPLEFLNYLVNHEQRELRLPRMNLAKFLPSCRIVFGHETIIIRQPAFSKHAAIVAIREYGATTDAGMLDKLLELPIEMTLTQSFFPIERQRALKLLDDAERFLIQSEDFASSQISEMSEAKDDVASGKMSFGEHSFYVLVYANTEKELINHVATVTSELAALGNIKAVREDINLENAYWSFFPGNGKYSARGTPINSRNFAGFSSFHNQPSGKRTGNHWGPAVTILTTKHGTPYFFNFHLHDLGHGTLIGPSGMGKTLLMCFLLAQAQKYKPRMIYLDYERGAEIFIQAIGGHYSIVKPGNKTGWNPLLLTDTPENRSFLRDWLSMLLTAHKEELTATERENIKKAIDGNYTLPPEHRRLEHIAPFLGMGMADSLFGRLQEWYGNGQRAYLFDNAHDTLDLRQGTHGFDMTHLLKDESARRAAFLYIYHRMDQALDGYPTIIPIDEAWAYFKDPYFANSLEEKLKIIRRKNGIILMGTNDVEDAAKSSISSTIITQSATNIFFGHNKAQYEDYKKFGLSRKEVEIIKNIKREDRLFLLKQQQQSVVLKLDLTGLEDYIAILSSNEGNANTLKNIIKTTGNNPVDWLPVFTNNRKEYTSCID